MFWNKASDGPTWVETALRKASTYKGQRNEEKRGYNVNPRDELRKARK